MRLGVVAVGVVAVVGGEQRRAQLACEPDELRVHPALLGEAVVLQLHEERVAAEDRLEAVDELGRTGVVVREQSLRHRAAEAARRGDESLVVPLEELEVDAGLVEEAVEVRVRRHLDEVAVALRRSRRAA